MSHGTLSAYNDGCRCDECRLRWSRYEKRRRYLNETGRPLTVPALGFKRRVRALMAIGWTHKQIAADLGIATGNLSNRMLYSQSVTRAMHNNMAALYERLSMTLPPDTMAARRTRSIAERSGYLPPLAYDDIDAPDGLADTTDTTVTVDPVVVQRILSGEWRLPANRAERLAVMAKWSGSLADLERFTGWNPARDRRLADAS